MKSARKPNRREWLKSTAVALAGLTLTGRSLANNVPALLTQPSDGLVRLSLNENPFGPSASAIAAMQSRLAMSNCYPTPEGKALINTIAKKEGVVPEQIVLGAGSGEILEAYGAFYGSEAGEVVSANPSYRQLVAAMERRGSRLVAVPLNASLELDLAAMAAAITPATRCVYVCNPNNPTGTMVDPVKLRAFAIEVSKTVPVFIDEAYLECSDDFAANTMVGLTREGHNVTIARTFSKIHGLAGQRIGYGILPVELARSIRDLVIGGPNLLGLVAAQANLDETDYVENTRRKIKAGRDALIAVLRDKGRRYAEPQGNFLFFQSGKPIADFRSAMLAKHVMVARPFPPYMDWCRITIGTPEEMAVVHAALGDLLV